MNSLTLATLIETHVDNEIAVQNLTRLARSKGFPVKCEKISEKHFAVTAEAQPPLETAAEEAALCLPEKRKDTVVAIDSAFMGRDSEELGSLLMKGFIYALSQQNKLPQTILFYNGGATLTCEGSASVEDLKSMEKQGVEILTCGTCLNYYNLSEKLQVGSVTNMYTIVEKLNGAAKVIKP